MNGYKKILWGVVALFFSTMVGCSQIVEVARQDFKRTVELADKYGKPEVKKCFTFLNAALDGLDANQATLDALLAENTEGVASLALKLVLIKEQLQSLNDPAVQAAFEKDFKTYCSAMAGDMFLAIMKDARNAAKRQPGVR